jgi:hypothetical protein
MSIREDLITTRWHYEFIHNVFACFYQDALEYFAGYLQPRIEHTVVSTYDKAVEFLSKINQYDREIDQPNLPALILNPSGDFNISENGGMQFWRFPNLAPGLVKRLFYPIYQDDNLLVTCGFSRFKGEIELIALVNSIYEYLDLKVLYLQIFGGVNRIIYPSVFSGFIIIPDELYNYQYTNEYTGKTYTMDWSTAGASDQLVKTTNRTEHVLPVNIRPWFKLTGMSDGSTKYGGTDKLADWRLVTTIEYEIEAPSFIVLESDYLAENIKMSINMGSTYSVYSDYKPPSNRSISKTSWDWQLNEDTNSDLDTDATASIVFTKELVFKTRYYHVVTESESQSETDVDIILPEVINDPDYLLVNYRYGLMDYGDHYIIVNNGQTLRIKVDNVNLVKNTAIELYVYTDGNGVAK